MQLCWFVIVLSASFSSAQQNGTSPACPCVYPQSPVTSYPNFRTIAITLEDLYQIQPLCITMVTNGGSGPGVDSTCYTFFRVANAPGNFQIYFSNVLSDGTVQSISALIKTTSCGSFQVTTQDLLLQFNFISYISRCNTLVSCVKLIYGDAFDFCLTFSNSCQRISPSCLQEALTTIQNSGANTTSYYVSPLTLPPGCITRQYCSIGSPFNRP